MSALDTTEQVMAVAWENYRREVKLARLAHEKKAREDGEEIRILNGLCDVWQPDTCKAPGCMTLVPKKAQLEQLRALGGFEWDPAREFAWLQGWCCAECSERDNILPFVRQVEAQP